MRDKIILTLMMLALVAGFFSATGTREIDGVKEEYKLYQWMIIIAADNIREE